MGGALRWLFIEKSTATSNIRAYNVMSNVPWSSYMGHMGNIGHGHATIMNGLFIEIFTPIVGG